MNSFHHLRAVRSASSESATGGDDTERSSRREAGDGKKGVGRIKRT
nr:MAG TPA: hypothetical protein [Caudoviricetes sp.]